MTTNTTPDSLRSCPPAARRARVERKTKESDIVVELDLDGTGKVAIDTGVPFFDHMLTALGTHASFDLTVTARGDVEIEGHHTIEDTAIVLGTALGLAWNFVGDRLLAGYERLTQPRAIWQQVAVFAAVLLLLTLIRPGAESPSAYFGF